MDRRITFTGIFFLAVGSFFLYVGSRDYLFPMGWRTLLRAVAYAGIGFLIALVGIILLLIGAFSNRRKKNAVE